MLLAVSLLSGCEHGGERLRLVNRIAPAGLVEPCQGPPPAPPVGTRVTVADLLADGVVVELRLEECRARHRALADWAKGGQ